jgi:hypothetical protein
MKPLLDSLITQLKEVQSGKLWASHTYDRKLVDVDPNWVFDRPIEQIHSIAEIISHLTFWRLETIVKIKTGKGSKTDDDKQNWLSNDYLRSIGWEKLKASYDNSLFELISLLEEKKDDFLFEKYYDPDFKGFFEFQFVLNGMLHHDLYHLGQIGIITKLLKEKHHPSP